MSTGIGIKVTWVDEQNTKAVGNEVENINEVRNRRPSTWLKDYDTGEGLSDEEAEINMIQSDLDSYEVAVKSSIW